MPFGTAPAIPKIVANFGGTKKRQRKMPSDTSEHPYGTATYEGVTITLTQMAYIDTDHHDGMPRTVYRASGRDADGNTYEAQWLIINPDTDDESDACNWHNVHSMWLTERAQ